MIEIEKDVPIPEKGANHIKYPWREMEVGDSFFWSGNVTRCQKAASQHGRMKGMKFTTRRCEESGVEGVRVWRIA